MPTVKSAPAFYPGPRNLNGERVKAKKGLRVQLEERNNSPEAASLSLSLSPSLSLSLSLSFRFPLYLLLPRDERYRELRFDVFLLLANSSESKERKESRQGERSSSGIRFASAIRR